MKKQTVTFVKERETKGAVRYQEQHEGDGEPLIGTLYVRKSRLDGSQPSEIKVTLEVVS